MTVKKGAAPDSLFGSQVFLLRHVQIEGKHYLQGFRLDEDELVAEVRQSADQLLREGMGFKLDKDESPNATHAAILDFGFGRFVLNFLELQPNLIADQVSQLKNWYFAINNRHRPWARTGQKIRHRPQWLRRSNINKTKRSPPPGSNRKKLTPNLKQKRGSTKAYCRTTKPKTKARERKLSDQISKTLIVQQPGFNVKNMLG